MVYPIKTNVMPLLQHLVAAIQPFALANEVDLHFESEEEEIVFDYHPENLIPDLTQLLCRIITLTPQTFTVKLHSQIIKNPEKKSMKISITNTGASLEHLTDITKGIRLNLTVQSLENSGTKFEIDIPIAEEEYEEEKENAVFQEQNSAAPIPAFYKKLHQQLKSHFTSIQNLEKAASARSQKEGIFLKKVNAIIMAHLDQEGFDTAALGKALALSRSQLYRRLKPLIRFSPAHYIRYVRLQKAKESLENGEGNIGEIAFRTGFISQSHFTRAFKGQFGFNPSQIK